MKSLFRSALLLLALAAPAHAQIGLLGIGHVLGNCSSQPAQATDCSASSIFDNGITGAGVDNSILQRQSGTWVGTLTPGGLTSVGVGLVAGGTAASSTLTLESTSGAGTTDAIILKTGSQVQRARITTGGSLLLGTQVTGFSGVLLDVNYNTAQPQAPQGGLSHIRITAPDAGFAAFTGETFGAGNSFFTMRAASGTLASPTALTAGHSIGSIAFYGYTGSVYNQPVSLTVSVINQMSGSDAGGFLDITTTPAASLTGALAMRVQGSGGVSVGVTTDPGIGSILANVRMFSPIYAGGTGTTSTVKVLGTTSGSPAAGNLATLTSNNSVVGVNVDNLGRIGLNTASPSSQMHVHMSTDSNSIWADKSATASGTGVGIWSMTDVLALTLFELRGTLIYTTTGGFAVGSTTDPGANNLYVTGSMALGTGGGPNHIIDIRAGTTGAAPIHLTGGTNMTTPSAGVIEYDGAAPYFTPIASNRGVLATNHVCALSADFTLTNVNTAQKAFNCSANGAVTLPGSVAYYFEAQYIIANTGTTAHTWGVLFGGTATFTSLNYSVVARTDSATTPSATNVFDGSINVATTVAVTASSTSATENVVITLRGFMRMNAGGTVIPQVQLSAATGVAATMKANSYFRLWPAGANVVTTIGNWS